MKLLQVAVWVLAVPNVVQAQLLVLGPSGDEKIKRASVADEAKKAENRPGGCYQVDWWIGTSTDICATAAAIYFRDNIGMGRVRPWSKEDNSPYGRWVRFWYSKFVPRTRADLLWAQSGGGIKFVVTNCWEVGKMNC